MGEIIVINGLEYNIGVSTIALTLAEKINFLTGKRICIVEMDSENTSLSYTLEKTIVGLNNLDSISSYIIDDRVTSELTNIIKVNAKKFKGAEISVIYGSKINKKLSQTQMLVLLNALRGMYDVVIVDNGDKEISKNLLDMISLNLLILQPSSRYINKLKKRGDIYVNEKTNFLLNMSSHSEKDVFLTLREFFNDRKLLGELPPSINLVEQISNGIISVNKGKYAIKISKVAISICNKLHLPIVQKANMVSRLLGKEVHRIEDLKLADYDTKPLGKLLIEKGYCTEEQINECLSLQLEAKSEGVKI